jgi:hypothetical protein
MTLKENIFGKNIIFFSVRTFNLENEIIKKIKEHGGVVDYFDERPSNSNFSKGIIRVKRSILQYKIDLYYKKILTKTINKEYKYLFVNRGEVIPAFFLKEFKKSHSKCIFIFYTWDSFNNNSHSKTILDYFDKKFTFDLADSLKYNLRHRPLFFLDSYRDIAVKNNKHIKYDLLFIGTAHSDRYLISNKISMWCEQNNLKVFCYYYMQGRLVYLIKKMFDKSFKKFDHKKLSFKSLNTNEILTLYSGTNVILDINHPGQKGLTMRTLESIGAKKKLITTNPEIKKYSFYNPNNVLIIDRLNFKIDKDFFQSEYEDIDDDLYEKLSITGWLEELFLEEYSKKWIKFEKKNSVI